MRARLWLLPLVLVACGGDEPAPAPPRLPLPGVPVAAGKRADPGAAEPAGPIAVPDGTAAAAGRADGEEFALRRYERLMNGRRAGTIEVHWTWRRDGERWLVEDVTHFRTRTARMMGPVRNVFESATTIRTLRTEEGELVSQETRVLQEGRTDGATIRRTAEGYEVREWTGDNEESFVVATDRAAQVDAETFLGPRLREGTLEAGDALRMPVLDTHKRKLVEVDLRVAGPDEEGPGLKVVESYEGNDTLWWFDTDGTVVRIRSGLVVTRRNDAVALDDLGGAVASYRITLPANEHLPRMYTGVAMDLDLVVSVDETTKPPRIPPNPFTEVLEAEDGRVRLRLKSHDDPGANVPYPVKAEGLDEFLRATPLMEVDDPAIRTRAKRVVGDAKDARTAALRLADWVFTHLEKDSPAIPQPTAKWIDAHGIGDCSEHSLYFTALCRAAGIPARRCSGWVCIGDDWGAHGWCEIWLGKWIGADPTTNEVGTRARYIFLTRPDDREMTGASITAERTRILIRRAEYVDGVIDFESEEPPDPVVWSGVRLGPLPEGWEANHSPYRVLVRGGSTMVMAQIVPDQGHLRTLTRERADAIGGATFTQLGQRPALSYRSGNNRTWIVPLGRENLMIQVMAQDDVSAETLAALFGPTLNRNG